MKLRASNGIMTLVHNRMPANESINQAALHVAEEIVGGLTPLNEDQDKNQGSVSEASGALLKSRGRSLEITGLGIIISLVVAFGSLVGDGTIQLSQYLIFVSLMSISAGGMVWRIRRLTPQKQTVAADKVQPGAYRVSFRS